MEFIKKHIFYIYPLVDIPTQKYINERFERLIEKEGVDFLVIDPFNQLVRDWELSNRDDRYIASYLQEEKRFAFKIIYTNVISIANNISNIIALNYTRIKSWKRLY